MFVSDIPKAFANIHRVLCCGGRIKIAVWGCYDECPAAKQMYTILGECEKSQRDENLNWKLGNVVKLKIEIERLNWKLKIQMNMGN